MPTPRRSSPSTTPAPRSNRGLDLPEASPRWVNLLDRAAPTPLRPRAIIGGGAEVTVVHEGLELTACTGDAMRIEVIGTDDLQPGCRFSAADPISERDCFADVAWDGEVDTPTSWDIRVGEGSPDRHQAIVTVTIDGLDLTLDVPVTLRCAG